MLECDRDVEDREGDTARAMRAGSYRKAGSCAIGIISSMVWIEDAAKGIAYGFQASAH